MPPEPNQIPKVRTFEHDVAESMQTKQASLLHIALAEQEHEKEVRVETVKKRTNGFLYFLSFLFILGALGAAGYGYFFYKPAQKATVPSDLIVAQDFVLVDETNSVLVDLNNRNSSLALLSATSSLDTTLGVVTQVIPYVEEAGSDSTKTKRAITSQEFFALIGDSVPDIFKRSLVKDMTFIRVIDNGIQGGIIVQTNDYDRTVIGLTAWEKNMVRDLEKLFGYSRRKEVKELIETIQEEEIVEEKEVYNPKTKKTEIVIATTTQPVSSFEERVSYVVDEVVFTNSVRKNIELRIAQGTSLEEYIVYGFPERSTLVVAGSVDAFLRIVSRLPSLQ